MAFDTLLAHAARDRRIDRDGLPFVQAFHTWPDCLDRTGELVAEDEWLGRHARADVSIAVIVDIRAAQSDCIDPHQNLSLTRSRCRHLIDLQLAWPVPPCRPHAPFPSPFDQPRTPRVP